MKLRPYGDRGVLLTELPDETRCQLLAQIEHELPEACDEFVVGYDSILLVGSKIPEIEQWLSVVPLKEAVQTDNRKCHHIEVSYDGEDLDYVAKACGLDVSEVIRIHCTPTYTVRMMGFSPGFPYLDGLDPRLHLDRRASPRNHIAPGTVAIGGTHAGIYSVASPGGWHLLGHTNLILFNTDAAQRSNPTPRITFALLPGDQVRFESKEASG